MFQFNISMNDVDGCNDDEKKSKRKEIKEKKEVSKRSGKSKQE